MSTALLKTTELPFCKGCGHDLIAKNTTRALEMAGYKPLDVIIVTDIGCHGIIDKCLTTHTVHGLHGRSVALGAGITFGLENPDLKVIVFIGDGGSTIGLQHILEAARLNLNMTVVVHNNFLYGMTGGQTSGLTPQGFRTTTSAEGNPFSGYDICALTHSSGAAYASRIMGVGDISGDLSKAFSVKGFSLIEVMEICPSYGVKLNPKRKLSEIIESNGKPLGSWTNERMPFMLEATGKTVDLMKHVKPIEKKYDHRLTKRMSLVISGSAGEGVQLAANLLVKAAIMAGCHATQKGSYPVTVGVGFSTAEVNLSPDDIHFHGIGVPDVAIVTSADGLGHSRKRIESMKSGLLVIDQSLQIPSTATDVMQFDFRQIGARTACLLAIFVWVKQSGVFPLAALRNAIEEAGMTGKLPIEKIESFI
jgi:2-oxoglutarate/2-oxoacid ferredoxin oxidoreductase subunit beta